MPMWLKRQLMGHRLMEEEKGGEGGSAGDMSPDVKAMIDKAVSDAVSGLKSKNGELLGKLKEREDKLKSFDGIEPDAVRNILRKFADEEEAALIAKGEIDTVLSKRTERMKSDYEKKLQAEADAKVRAESKAAKLAERTLAGALRDAAIKSGAIPEALEDIVLRASSLWRLNDEGDPVAMQGDEIVLGKDGKTPLTPKEWAESLREAAPHLWPRASGTNAPGSNGAGKSSFANKKASEMTSAEKAKYIGENGVDKWRQKVESDYAK